MESLAATHHEAFISNPSIGIVRSERAVGRTDAARSLAVARWLLLRGEVDRPMQLLEALRGNFRDRWDYNNDFAVVLAERYRRKDDPLDLLLGLKTAQTAARLAPESPTAAFNLALLLEKTQLRSQAILAWHRLLQMDVVDPAWRLEGSIRLHRLTRAMPRDRWRILREVLVSTKASPQLEAEAVLEFPAETRVFVEETFLPEWAEAHLTGSSTSSDLLTRARELARLFAETRDDQILLETTGLLSSGNSRRDDRMARGLAAFGRGMKHYRTQSYASAIVDLKEAVAFLQAEGSPHRFTARFYLASCIYSTRFEDSIPLFEQLKREVDPGRYPSVAAHIRWMTGSTLNSRNYLHAASLEYKELRPLLQRAMGDRQQAITDLLLAELSEKRGDVVGAWRHRMPALAALLGDPDPKRAHSVLFEAAFSLEARGQRELALLFLAEARHNLENVSMPFAQAEIELLVSQLHLPDHPERAQAAAGRAIAAAEAMQAGGLKQRTLSWAQLTGAMVEAVRNEQEGLVAMDRAHAQLTVGGWSAQELKYRSVMARRLRSSGKLEEARKVLEQSVDIYERRKHEISSGAAKAMIQQEARTTFQEMLDLALLQRSADPLDAFLLGERSKLTGLFELPSSGMIELSPSMPTKLRTAGVNLLAFSVLPDRIVGWAFDAGGHFTQKTLDLSPSEVEEAARAFSKAVSSDDMGMVIELGGHLFDRLIAPFGLDLDPDHHLFIVPDGFLDTLPFSALYDSRRQLFLVEQCPWSLAPTATAALERLERHRTVAPRDLRALLIGNPKLSAERDLPTLMAAGEEARKLTDLYLHHQLLVEETATREALLANLRGVELLHFAGHAISTSPRMADNCLVLAEAPPPARDEICVDDLTELGPTSLDLVYLGACASLGGFNSEEGEHFRVAQGFLSLGARAVVAPYKPIEDEASARFAQYFHANFARNVSASAALRAAVLDVLRDPKERSRCSHWAAFAVLGY